MTGYVVHITSCSFICYSMYVSNNLWCQRLPTGVFWYKHPQGENSMAVFGFGCKFPQWGHFSCLKRKWF